MTWLTLLIIMAFIIRAVTKVYDKYLITTNNFDSDIYAIYTRGYSIIFVLLLLPFVWSGLSVTSFSIFALLAGFFKFFSLVFFFHCLKKSDAAVSVGLKQSFGFILPIIFFSTIDKNNLTIAVALSILIIVSLLFVVLKDNFLKKYFGITKSNYLMLGISVALEFGYIAILSFESAESFVWLFCWSRLGAFIAALLYLVLFKKFHKLVHATTAAGIYTNAKIGINEIAALFSKFATIYLLTRPAITNTVLVNSEFMAPILVIAVLSIVAYTHKRIYGNLTISSFKNMKFIYASLLLLLIFQATLER